MRRLVHEGFFENPILDIKVGLPGMNEEELAASTEWLHPFMNEDDVDVLARHCREATDDYPIFVGLNAGRRAVSELRVDLDLRRQTIVKRRVEKKSVNRRGSVHSAIEHRAHSLAGIGRADKRAVIGLRDDVRIDET